MSPQDPFGEQQAMRHRGRFDVLGVRVAARSNSRRLLALFGEAFGSLPRHDLGTAAPRIDVTLSLLPSMARCHRDVPRVKLRSGAGFPSLMSSGGGPRPSIATSFFTRSGYVPAYCSVIEPPSEWPMIVIGKRPSESRSCATSSV